MADFAVRITRITEPVENHPKADRLSIVRVNGYLCIAAKLNDGSHRYAVGDHVAYIPEAAILPEPILRSMSFWRDGKGTLAGAEGNRVKAMTLRGVLSQGVLYPVEKDNRDGSLMLRVPIWVNDEEVGSTKYTVTEGQDVADKLGVTKHVPTVPQSMDGKAIAVFGVPSKFDVESIQAFPDMFEEGEAVHVTEKLHGTCIQIGYVPDLNNRQCFYDGNLYVTQKGLGNQGLVLTNSTFLPPEPLAWPMSWMHALGLKLGFAKQRPEVEVTENSKTLYVTMLRNLLEADFGQRIAEFARLVGPVRVFGEVFGRGVQDLHYGLKAPALRVFDVKVGNAFLPPDEAMRVATDRLGLQTVPTLYRGPFDRALIESLRDGKDMLSGTNVREGVVIRSMSEARHPLHGRKIAKWVSPDYLTRRGAGEEFQ